MHYTIQRQLTVALQNQPGRLAAICQLMAEAGINVEALSLIDNIEQGVIRLVTSDPPLCKQLLLQEGLYVVEADVLVLDLIDSPGQLAQVSTVLAKADLNIDFAYGSVDRVGEKTRLVVKVSNLSKACQVLAAVGLEP
ncbi:ACT domain-containing protein [Anthocerotibacter panamensis]|uniref:ACT domain-containing protein n=1 Tax=Anthocerotibacter panamensis TaxID=2857077 RepID=UPI001C407F79|nr:ACT domain-containing protein [Anthocerotibacter panamensis]